MMRCYTAMIGLITAGAFSAAAGAEPLGQAELLEQLASDSYAERAQAHRELLSDTALGVDELEELFSQADTLEQHHRLMDVAQHHVVRIESERLFAQPGPGSLGIAHETVHHHGIPDWDRPAVKVLQTLIGLPAYGQLKTGDLILTFQDQQLPADASRQHFGQMIANYDRGERVQLSVYRDGQIIDVEIELGSLAALESMFPLHTMQLADELQQAWLEYRQTFRGHMPEPTALRPSDEQPTADEQDEDDAPAVTIHRNDHNFSITVEPARP